MRLHPRPSRSPRTWLALAIVAAYAIGCASLAPPPTPRARFVAAAAAFEGAATVAYAYGRAPSTSQEDREMLASVGDAAVVVIRNARDSMKAGTITDRQLEAAATFLEAAAAQLQAEVN